MATVTDGQTAVIDEVVADKGYHSNQVLVDLAALDLRTYIAEPVRGRRNWTKKAMAREAVYANRRRIRRARGLALLRRRSAHLERPNAHLYETGGMRRTHLRGHARWNGASFKQIQDFLSDFSAESAQLPTNYRCPPSIVEAANRLVAYNAQRTTAKEPLLAGKTHLKYPEPEHLQLRVFKTDDEEATSIAAEISALGSGLWRQTTVLARTRAHLERMHAALDECQVPCVIAQRRDDFLSAEFRWLTALLRQVVRPLDRRNMAAVVDSFNRMADQNIAVDQVITDAETTGRGYLATWLQTANDIDASRGDLLDLVGPFTTDSSAGKSAIDAILEAFAGAPREADADSDLVEDMSAWRDLARDIARHIGRNAPLDQFLQQLELRSKEPTPKPDTVNSHDHSRCKGQGI